MKTISQAALELYSPPFKFKYGYIFDNTGKMVADNGMVDELKNMIALRIRGWGVIQYLEEFNPEELQDEVGKHCANALTQYWESKLRSNDSE